jgi:hypothetical protein
MKEAGERVKWLESRSIWLQAIVGVIAIILLALAIYALNYYRSLIGIEQPIPFSHRVHAHVKKISCFMCHPEAIETARAGIPPLQTCMLCHSRIAITYPPIKRLRDQYFEGKPVIWKKVYSLPDFVYFDHSVHIHRRIDCSHCHGDVPLMDRIVKQQDFTMGFCIGCHKKNNATHDCLTCHR